MMRPPIIRTWDDHLIVDNFAGGGGASSGIELALGRSPDLAVNHDDEALAMHAANHPMTEHRCESVWDVDPLEATQGKPVALAWFSPTCTHFSKAKGTALDESSIKIRGLAWIAVRWAAAVKPRVIALENVEEFEDWGPLDRETGQPIKRRKGQTFRAFVRKLEALGYCVEWRQLRACDYGAPTYRKRLFLIARCDGQEIRWPTPTHGPMTPAPYRTAGECMDWTLPMPSIFERPKPLVESSLRRIARGIRQFVLETRTPYFVPMPAARGDHALAVPFLIHQSNGERPGQAPRIYDINKPIGTIMAQGSKHALCVAFLMKNYSERPTGGWNGGQALDRPMGSITVRDHHALVAAFLIRYNGTSGPQSLDRPMSTIDTRDRFGLVTVTIDRESWIIFDVGMRHPTARELFRCQGFADEYQIAVPGPSGKPLSDTAQKRMCGNSVAPPIAAAIIRAQFDEAA